MVGSMRVWVDVCVDVCVEDGKRVSELWMMVVVVVGVDGGVVDGGCVSDRRVGVGDAGVLVHVDVGVDVGGMHMMHTECRVCRSLAR